MSEDKRLVVYHNDIDGHASGAIIRCFLEKQERAEVTMLEMNFDREFPWELVNKNTIVYMADFCLQPWEGMAKLKDRCKNFIWIDHHKSAIADYLNWSATKENTINGLREISLAGCQLTWQYCTGISEPLAITYAGLYDIWKWQDNINALHFQHGIKMYETDPATQEGFDLWKTLISGEYQLSKVKDVCNLGEIVLNSRTRQNEKFIKDNAFETEIDGLKVIAVNRKSNSQQFESVWNPAKYDAMLTFGWANSCWTVSLYTDKSSIDVSKTAVKYGGGGHKGAAGFQVKELPFELR